MGCENRCFASYRSHRREAKVALVHALDHLLGHGHQRDRRLHAFGVLHLPHQLVDGRHGFVARAAFGTGLDHYHQHVGAGGVVVDDEVVDVVGGIIPSASSHHFK